MVLAETSSTNDVAFQLAETDGRSADGAVITAESQTAGRGRSGHKWHAGPGQSLLCSALLAETQPIEPAETLSLCAGVCACAAIERTTPLLPRLRWPNDIYFADRKVAGVLIERRFVGDVCFSVIGVGINCHQTRVDFPTELAERATSIDLELARSTRESAARTLTATTPNTGRTLRAELLTALLDTMNEFLSDRPLDVARIDREWLSRTDDIGQRVTLDCSGITHTGRIESMSAAGWLDIRMTDGAVERFAGATTRIVARHGGS